MIKINLEDEQIEEIVRAEMQFQLESIQADMSALESGDAYLRRVSYESDVEEMTHLLELHSLFEKVMRYYTP